MVDFLRRDEEGYAAKTVSAAFVGPGG